MPAFTFEKISSPVHHGAQAVAVQTVTVRESRGVIVQMIDRLTESRIQREAVRKAKNKTSFTEADIKPT